MASSIDEVVEEIMRIHRSLPSRPGLDELEAAKALIRNLEKEDQARLDAIARQTKSTDVPEELFIVLQEMQKSLVFFHAKEQKREALRLLDLESLHSLFDDFIQRASKCLPFTNSAEGGSLYNRPKSSAATSTSSSSLYCTDKDPLMASKFFAKDDSYVNKAKSTFYVDGTGIGIGPIVSSTTQILDPSLKPPTTSSVQDGEKLSLIKLASLIEVSAKKGTRDLNLQNKLMDQIEWLPDSIGKLSSLITLDLSDNRIVALPDTIGGLSSLTKLDLHSNRISELPDAIGDLLNLIYLDLSGNQLSSLPATFGRLVHLQELDLSSNRLSFLPESIGSLVSIKKLNVETNSYRMQCDKTECNLVLHKESSQSMTEIHCNTQEMNKAGKACCSTRKEKDNSSSKRKKRNGTEKRDLS